MTAFIRFYFIKNTSDLLIQSKIPKPWKPTQYVDNRHTIFQQGEPLVNRKLCVLHISPINHVSQSISYFHSCVPSISQGIAAMVSLESGGIAWRLLPMEGYGTIWKWEGDDKIGDYFIYKWISKWYPVAKEFSLRPWIDFRIRIVSASSNLWVVDLYP